MVGLDREITATVGSVSEDGQLQIEWNLTKNALLYADKVVVNSPNVALAIEATRCRGDWGRIKSIFHDLPDGYIPEFGQTGKELSKLVNDFDRKLRSKNLSGRQRGKIKRAKKEAIEQIADAACESFDLELAENFDRLEKEGVIDISGQKDWRLGQTIGEASIANIEGFDESLEVYLRSLVETIHAQDNLPIFGEHSSGIIRSLYGDGNGEESPSPERVAESTEGALAIELFDDLPALKDAPADEILGVREELTEPLENFRGALMNYSDQIGVAGWDEEFESRCREVYRKTIKPELNELSSRIEQNTLAKQFFSNIFSKEAGVSSLLGLGATNSAGGLLDSMPAEAIMLSAASMVGGSALGALMQAVSDKRDEQEDIQRNKLFFYRAAQDELSG